MADPKPRASRALLTAGEPSPSSMLLEPSRPKTHAVSRSILLDRVAGFLPAIAASNLAVPSSPQATVDVCLVTGAPEADAEDDAPGAEPHVEMDLYLGAVVDDGWPGDEREDGDGTESWRLAPRDLARQAAREGDPPRAGITEL